MLARIAGGVRFKEPLSFHTSLRTRRSRRLLHRAARSGGRPLRAGVRRARRPSRRRDRRREQHAGLRPRCSGRRAEAARSALARLIPRRRSGGRSRCLPLGADSRSGRARSGRARIPRRDSRDHRRRAGDARRDARRLDHGRVHRHSLRPSGRDARRVSLSGSRSRAASGSTFPRGRCRELPSSARAPIRRRPSGRTSSSGCASGRRPSHSRSRRSDSCGRIRAAPPLSA